LYEKRIQKLIFYGEVFTAQHFGERLTNSDFMPYHHGPYSQAVTNAISHLQSENRISVIPHRPGSQYMTEEEGGELSPQKKDWIKKIHEDTSSMSTDSLVNFAKDTWLWEEFEHEEYMDFSEYMDEVIPPVQSHYKSAKSEKAPASDSRVEELLL